MRTLVGYICALLLIMPIPSLAFVGTLLHVAEHAEIEVHQHEAGSAHTDAAHDHDDHPDEMPAGHDLSHRHAPHQPTHSHNLDACGSLANVLAFPLDLMTVNPESAFLEVETPTDEARLAEAISVGLFRPPIAVLTS